MTQAMILYALLIFLAGVLTGLFITERRHEHDDTEVASRWGEIDRAATRAAHGATAAMRRHVYDQDGDENLVGMDAETHRATHGPGRLR